MARQIPRPVIPTRPDIQVCRLCGTSTINRTLEECYVCGFKEFATVTPTAPIYEYLSIRHEHAAPFAAAAMHQRFAAQGLALQQDQCADLFGVSRFRVHRALKILKQRTGASQ